MNRGAKAALLISSVAIGGCTGAAPEVKVRAIDNASAQISRSGDALAVARGQLMLGNAGLALEAFRKAQRDNPSDPAVLSGIGDCYSAMGRFDLAQTNYESALALAPHDRKLLLGLAAIYEREGNRARAMIARAEAAASLPPAPAVAAALPQAEPARPKRVGMAAAAPAKSRQEPVAIPKPAIGSITIELPQARPAARLAGHVPESAIEQLELAQVEAAPVASAAPVEPAVLKVNAAALRSITVELPAASPASHLQAQDSLPTPELLLVEAEPENVSSAPLPAPAEQPIVHPALAGVAVELAAAHPVQRLEEREIAAMAQIEEYPASASSLTVPLPPVRPTRRAPAPVPPQEERRDAAVALPPSPRLERLSLGEVALVTTGKPLWKTPGNVQTASTTTVRWVALESSRDRPNVRILNAARSQGLAASARTVLRDRGWRKLAVGDAPTVLRKSVVLYPKGREALGRRLARQFGVSAQMAERDDVVLMLGRDSVHRIGG